MAKPQKRIKWWMFTLFRRRVLVALLLLVQLVFFIYMFVSGITLFRWLYAAFLVLSFVSILFIITRRKVDAYKLPWMMLIAILPAFGGLLFFLIHGQSSSTRLMRRYEEVGALLRLYLEEEETVSDRFSAVRPAESQRSRFLSRQGYPLYAAGETEFYPSGEAFFAGLKAELRRAERYIFLEYFIIADGEMWDEIHAILLDRIAAGVEVRLIYDDMGSLMRLPYRYDRVLEAEGIKTILFNPFRPAVTALQNNRDHRKITVIDGRVAFTGGINLGDEYINRELRFGHWADTAVRITGPSVRSFTAMFLEMWLVSRNEAIPLAPYFAACDEACASARAEAGFVQPYADTPLDGEATGAWVYDHILRCATDYVWITTPYLILDDAMCTSLTLAAKSGVDVRVVLPGVPDKKLVHATSRSYYLALLEAGVKVYEYTPGFMHAKLFLCDDRSATVGTVNLDYRSLFLHFECGAWMTDVPAVGQIKDYFTALFPQCREVHADELRRNLLHRIRGALLQLFAPFM